MPITITCPTCGKAGKVPDGSAGFKVTCPSCKARFAVPGQPAEAQKEEVPVLELADEPEPPAQPSRRRRRREEEPTGFQCIHCGSRKKPRGKIESSPTNHILLTGLLFLCCVFAFVLYPLLAQRTHYCADCGLRLES